MTCQDYEILINKELDHGLSSQERVRLNAHLLSCPECRRLAEEYRRLDQLLAERISQVDVPADFCGSVMSALAQQPSPEQIISLERKRRRQTRRWAIGGVAAAAILLFGIGASALLRQNVNEQPLDAMPIVAELSDEEQAPFLRSHTPRKEQQSGAKNLPDRETELSDPSGKEDQQPPERTALPEKQPGKQQTPSQQTLTPQQPGQQTVIDQSHNNEFSLPPVAYGSTTHGTYSLLTLAAVEGYDAKLPRVNGNTVTFYVETEDAYLEYQADINGAAPVFLGETESLPSAKTTAACSNNSSFDYRCVEANYANGLTVRNCGGEHQGLWLVGEDGENQLTETGGGSLVSWAADGNKILFTDASDHLQLYYLAEGILLNLSDTAVHSFCWSSDGRAVVFSAYDKQTGYYSIFKVVIP